MLILFSIISCALLLAPSDVFGGQEISVFQDKTCDPKVASWTSWFNIQDPLINNGNDVEELMHIKVIHSEAKRCGTVLNVDYSVLQKSNDEAGPYQTLINQNGLFCMGTRASRCPNYKVRFCCPLASPSPANQCGQTFNPPRLQSSLRIVNGFEARPHSLPWAVSLQYKGVHDCGGVILDQWNILTAAHCLDYANDLGNYIARVGAHHRYTSGQAMPIAQLIIHPKYNETRSSDDIGIVKLARPIIFTNEIQPICLVDNVCKAIRQNLLLLSYKLFSI